MSTRRFSSRQIIVQVAIPGLAAAGLGWYFFRPHGVQAEQTRMHEDYWPTRNTTQQFENLALDQYLEVEEDRDHFKKLAWRTLVF